MGWDYVRATGWVTLSLHVLYAVIGCQLGTGTQDAPAVADASYCRKLAYWPSISTSAPPEACGKHLDGLGTEQ